jgi:hypothetical protein
LGRCRAAAMVVRELAARVRGGGGAQEERERVQALES